MLNGPEKVICKTLPIRGYVRYDDDRVWGSESPIFPVFSRHSVPEGRNNKQVTACAPGHYLQSWCVCLAPERERSSRAGLAHWPPASCCAARSAGLSRHWPGSLQSCRWSWRPLKTSSTESHLNGGGQRSPSPYPRTLLWPATYRVATPRPPAPTPLLTAIRRWVSMATGNWLVDAPDIPWWLEVAVTNLNSILARGIKTPRNQTTVKIRWWRYSWLKRVRPTMRSCHIYESERAIRSGISETRHTGHDLIRSGQVSRHLE